MGKDERGGAWPGLIFDSVKIQAWRLVNEHTYGEVNRAHAVFHGLEKEDLEFRDMYDVFSAEHAELIRRDNESVFKTGKEEQVGRWVEGHSGGRRFLLITKVPVLADDGGAMSVACSAVDITDSAEARRALEESERRYEQVVEHSLIFLWEVDPSGLYTRVSPSVEKVTGYLPEELVGKKHFYDICPEEDRGKIRKTGLDTIRGRRAFTGLENRIAAKDGRIIWVSTSGLPVPDAGGELLCYRGSDIDITERKLAGEELREREERLRLIAASISDAVLETDLRGFTTYVSPSYSKVMGGGGEGIGSTIFEHIHPEDINRVRKAFLRGLRTGLSQRVEFRYSHAEKGFIWMEAAGQRYVNKVNEVKGLITIRDINERKLAEHRITYIGYHDNLTSLYNRGFAEEEMRRLDRNRQLPISVIMCDVNGLKLVNDAFGHPAGDDLLVRAADVLRKSCRGEDIVARWGGDEFIVFLPKTSAEGALKIAGRITDISAEPERSRIPLSIAAGAATKRTAKKRLPDVLAEAEDAMYRMKLEQSERFRLAVLDEILRVLGEKTFETGAHLKRLETMVQNAAAGFNLSRGEIERLFMLIPSHDIGMIVVPENMLLSPGTLREDEMAVIRKHSASGHAIALSTAKYAAIAGDILSHHERWDGLGYPQGLKGFDAPLSSRIMAVIHSYDSMTDGRPYRRALTGSEAVSEIKRLSGAQFDPVIADKFAELCERNVI